MRPVCLSRKNSLFAGSNEGAENWACLASLIETCKLNGVNPHAYFTDLLTRLVNGWSQKRIDELMPWLWVPQHPGLFNAQYMTRMARIALMPPKAMRCRPSETL